MTRSDLVEKLAQKFSTLSKRDVEKAVDVIFDEGEVNFFSNTSPNSL